MKGICCIFLLCLSYDVFSACGKAEACPTNPSLFVFTCVNIALVAGLVNEDDDEEKQQKEEEEEEDEEEEKR